MSDSNNSRPLISSGTVVLIIAAIIAYSSNPDEENFRYWVKQQVNTQANGAVEYVTGNVVSQLALNILAWRHTDYGFFSVVHFPDLNVTFVGAFGYWWNVGEIDDSKAMERRT